MSNKNKHQKAREVTAADLSTLEQHKPNDVIGEGYQPCLPVSHPELLEPLLIPLATMTTENLAALIYSRTVALAGEPESQTQCARSALKAAAVFFKVVRATNGAAK